MYANMETSICFRETYRTVNITPAAKYTAEFLSQQQISHKCLFLAFRISIITCPPWTV